MSYFGNSNNRTFFRDHYAAYTPDFPPNPFLLNRNVSFANFNVTQPPPPVTNFSVTCDNSIAGSTTGAARQIIYTPAYEEPERSQTPTFAGSGAPILAGDDHDEIRHAVLNSLTSDQINVIYRLRKYLNSVTLHKHGLGLKEGTVTCRPGSEMDHERTFPAKVSDEHMDYEGYPQYSTTKSNEPSAAPGPFRESSLMKTLQKGRPSFASSTKWVRKPAFDSTYAKEVAQSLTEKLNNIQDDDQPPDKPAAEPEKQDSSSVEKSTDSSSSSPNEKKGVQPPTTTSSAPPVATSSGISNSISPEKPSVETEKISKSTAQDMQSYQTYRFGKQTVFPPVNIFQKTSPHKPSIPTDRGAFSLRIINGHKITGSSRACFAHLSGKCRLGAFCRFEHDGKSEKPKICSRLLRGLCRPDNETCGLEHTALLPHQYPVCSFFERGDCSAFPDCKLLHVKHSTNTIACDKFNRGECHIGVNCEYRHVYHRSLRASMEDNSQPNALRTAQMLPTEDTSTFTWFED